MFRSLPRGRMARFLATSARPPKEALTILYGSQTGSTANFAQQLGTFAKSFNFDVTVKPIDEFEFDKLPAQKPRRTILLTSTCGTGELPRNAERFVDWLDTKKPDLSKLDYALFGFGSSNYDTFNWAAKEIDSKLQGLGAKQFHKTGLGDQVSKEGIHNMFQDWMLGLWGPWLSEGITPAMGSQFEATPTTAAAAAALPDWLFPAGQVVGTVVANRSATTSGSSAAGLMQVKVDKPYDFLGYISVQPKADPQLVDRLLKRLKLNGEDRMEVTGPDDLKYVATVRQLFSEVVDISAMPTRAFLMALAFSTTDPKERAQLERLGTDFSDGNRYSAIARDSFLTLVDLLEQFPSAAVSVSQLLSGLPPIQPRTYSIASDPAAQPGHLDVVYSIVTSEADGRKFKGLTTGFLEQCKAGDTFRCKVTPDKSDKVAPNAPLVGVGLGTGIAPFRAILQQRAHLKAKGEAVAPVLLYFGFRTLKGHFLFQEELQGYQQQGLLELVYTCSHDQPQMITPLDSIDAEQKKVIRRLNEGATFLFCGSGGIFPKLLRAAVQQAADACDLDADYVQTLLAKKQYQEHFFTVDQDVENQMRAVQAQRNATLPMAQRFAGAQMFCFQCEQTHDGIGCTTIGVCGKTPEMAGLQDLLVHGVKILGWYLHHAKQVSKDVRIPAELHRYTIEGLFATLTNVNFDNHALLARLHRCSDLIAEAKQIYLDACAAAKTEPQLHHAIPLPAKAALVPARMADLVLQSKLVGVLANYKRGQSEDAAGVVEMLVYGLKGLAAYTDHCLVAGVEDAAVYDFMAEALAFTLSAERFDLGKALAMSLKCGEVNFKVMAMLYRSNSLLGVPQIREVPANVVPGKCILVSGHDLHVLKSLLVATEGQGINVFTHGEMLPAHSYPELFMHKHLAGHFGGPWNRQSVEFPHFPGAIVMTTNCLTEPKPGYAARLFTFGVVGWEGVPHLGDHLKDVNWTTVIKSAQGAPGFAAVDAGKPFAYPQQIGLQRPQKYTVGFGHEAVLAHAGTVLQEIQKGNISRFFLIGGCDGYEGARNYFTDVGENLPETAVVLTLGCGKYRVNHMDMGTIGDTGIPRLLDMGQCNDSHSAVLVALALADALKCKVSDLPLSFVISWLEQKAVAVFLTMLHLGLKPIYLGPHLPAFATPAVLDVLVRDFGVVPAGDPKQDVAAMTKNDPKPKAKEAKA